MLDSHVIRLWMLLACIHALSPCYAISVSDYTGLSLHYMLCYLPVLVPASRLFSVGSFMVSHYF